MFATGNSDTPLEMTTYHEKDGWYDRVSNMHGAHYAKMLSGTFKAAAPYERNIVWTINTREQIFHGSLVMPYVSGNGLLSDIIVSDEGLSVVCFVLSHYLNQILYGINRKCRFYF